MIASHKDVNIRWKSRVDDRFLSQLYAESDFTVFPSLAEGFGLPIVESLWHGRPVICHNEGAIRETASGGGCLLADMNSEKDLSAKILRLGGDRELREELTRQAISAPVKTWIDYAGEVASVLRDADEKSRPPLASLPKPLLSICVTTYNRAGWLAHSLPLILEQTKPYQDAVEVVVCDNASQDETPNVVTGFGHYANLRFHRNEKNVGMLGNLAVSSNQGRGRYVWVIGDDDLMIEGAIERVLTAVTRHPETELIYMNYAFTRFDRPQDLIDTRQVIRTARPISANFKDEFSTKISSIAAKTENCFTAIYCLIYRADHAKLAYNQDTSGAPFSTLKTCVPTADYVCRNMFDRPGYWIGDPCMVVNLNVSWMSYASLYILERFPELYDLMRERGADSAQVDRIQAGQLPGVMAWLESIYLGSQRENLPHFSMKRLIDRFARLPEFRRQWGTYFNVYLRAFQKGLTEDASLTPKDVQDYYAKKVQEIVP